MAELTRAIKARNALRNFPIIYAVVRRIRRFLEYCIIEIGRRVCSSTTFGAPKGTFSGLVLVQSGQTEGKMVRMSQELPPLPQQSLIREADMKQNGEQPWPVFWSHLPCCRLVGPSLLPMNGNKEVMIEAAYGQDFFRSDPSYNYLVLPPPVGLQGAWTSVIGRWSEGYYHWFTDALPRLASLNDLPPETKILTREQLEGFAKVSLEMLGLLDRVRETKETHLAVEDFYFLSPVGMTGCTNPESVKWLREAFLPHAAPGDFPAKVFIRREGKTRGMANKREVENLFREKGWWVIDLEKLAFAEQIAVFSRATHIVGEHGAGFTNLLWCNPGCQVLELCANNYLNGCYEGISLCIGLKHAFLIETADAQNQFAIDLGSLSYLFK